MLNILSVILTQLEQIWYASDRTSHTGAAMGKAMQVGWRWFRLKLYQLREGKAQALGDNFPFFPCVGVKVIARLAKLNR